MRDMEPGSLPPAPPSTADVLRWCAAAAPNPWFPSDHAQSTGIPRDSLDDPLWLLRQAGLLQVGEWVRGKGQGFTTRIAFRQTGPGSAGGGDGLLGAVTGLL